MATKKKTKTKKVAAKPASSVKATKKKVVKKNVVKKKAVKKKIALKKTSSKSSKIKVTLEQRHKMICEAAYYISLNRTYKTVNPTEDWLKAEAAISKICVVHTK